MDLHRFEEAAQEFQIVHGLMPGAPEPYNGIGNALLLQGKLERAMKQYQEALSIDRTFLEHARPWRRP